MEYSTEQYERMVFVIDKDNIPASRPLWLAVIGPNTLKIDLKMAKKINPGVTLPALVKAVQILLKDKVILKVQEQ